MSIRIRSGLAVSSSAFLLLGTFLLAAPAGLASENVYLETNPQIRGSAIDPGFVDAIIVESLSAGAVNDACAGGGKGAAALLQVSFVKFADPATVDLLRALRDAITYNSFTFSLTRNFESGPQAYQVWELQNAQVSSYSAADSSTVFEPASEAWSVSFSALTVTYNIHDSSGNQIGTEAVTLTSASCP